MSFREVPLHTRVVYTEVDVQRRLCPCAHQLTIELTKRKEQQFAVAMAISNYHDPTYEGFVQVHDRDYLALANIVGLPQLCSFTNCV